VNQLRVTADGREARSLTLEERDTIIYALDNKKPTKTLSSMNINLVALAKILKLRNDERFTLETGVRDTLACDPLRAIMTHPDRFGSRWSTLDWQAQWEVIQHIRKIQSDAEFADLLRWLMDKHGLDKDHAEKAANAHLPEGYARLGFTATQTILEHLTACVLTYSEAVEACGWHHSDRRTGECLSTLPYYGAVLDRHVIPGTYDEKDDDITRYGRITNPTVHIGLNQLRRLVNKIIAVYGKPDQIVVELARELKLSGAQKTKEMQRIRNTTADAIRRSEQLAEIGQPNTGHNRMLLRLWEDLGPAVGPRKCPYTGKTISLTMVFDGSCDVDHILPYSRTLDDSFSNRTLCLKEANRGKSDQTPWEIWGDTQQWDSIEANLKNLPDNKRWRFAPDAMQQFEGKRDFLDRALVDTQYLARISRAYLDTLYTEGGHVWVVPGRMTEMLRRHWGLNGLLSDKDRKAVKAKNRTDHRHHAIDAAVVAATDRSLVNRISKAAGQGERAGQSAELIARSTPFPWEEFRNDIESQLSKIVVSHRADHGRIDLEGRKKGCDSTAGQLHNDTAYGIVDSQTVVSRTPLLSLKPSDIELTTKGKNIRDPYLQKMLSAATMGKEGKALEAALRDFAAQPGPYQGIRRVRLAESLQETARIPVPMDKPIKAYKGDSNHCYELWRLPDGKIKPQIITTFQAHANADRRPHPAAKRLLRVFKRDMVALERDGETVIGYVQSMHITNGLYIAPHLEANADARNRDKSDSFRFIQIGAGPMAKAGLRRVFVDEIGHLRDPGTPF
jgi:CRISPR-associated endonuclease Csn1